MYAKIWLHIEVVDDQGNQSGFFKDLESYIKLDVAWTPVELERVLKTYKGVARMWDATEAEEAAIVEEFGRFQREGV